MQTLSNPRRTARTSSIELSPPTAEEAAFLRLQAEFGRVADADLRVVNVDVASAVRTIKVAVPRLQSLCPIVATALPGFDATVIDRLTEYADALAFLDAECKRRPASSMPTLEEYAEAFAFRGTLLVAVRLLASLGHIDTRTLGTEGWSKDHASVGRDLVNLCRSLLEAPPRLRRRSPFTRAQLRHGLTLGRRILDVTGERDRAEARKAAVHKARQRAFTVLYNAYHDVRRAVSFVRWHMGDANTYAPALIPGRGRRASVPHDDAVDREGVAFSAGEDSALQRAS